MPGLRGSLAERLWRRVDRQGDGCWEWQGAVSRANGYGKIGRGRLGGGTHGMISTHRAAWLVTFGPIPDGLFVLHRCDNPPCCRPDPDHLFLGTQAENLADMAAKGREARKLSTEQIAEIRRRYRPYARRAEGAGCSAQELAREFGVHEHYLRKLLRTVVHPATVEEPTNEETGHV